MELRTWTLAAGALAMGSPALAADECLPDLREVVGRDVTPMLRTLGEPTVETALPDRRGSILTWIDERTGGVAVAVTDTRGVISRLDVTASWLESNTNPLDIFFEPPP